MKALDNALHSLRPLVENENENENWDYLVVWKLGDDPSRFIQWVGCCCSGAYGVCENVEEEKAEEGRGFVLCRDTVIKHFSKSKACLELAKFPSSIPLYSGNANIKIHGETVITTEARWLSSFNKDSTSSLCHELAGTRVLIPVVGGLVELFTTRNVPKDENIIAFVRSKCKIKIEDEPVSLIDQYSHNGSTLLNHFNLTSGLKVPTFSSLPQTNTYPSFEGSSSGSNPTHENFSLNSYSGHVSPNGSVNELIEKNQIYANITRDINYFVGKEKENVNSEVKIEKDQFQSKNLITERNRRQRIKDGLLTLRSLVPKISKMDKASILVDAIAYIEELHNEKKQLEEELKDTTEEETNKKKTNPNSDKEENAKKRKKDQSSSHDMKQIQVQIEVNQLGKRDFLVKILSNHKKGGFARLIEGMYSLGLQVIDANTTTFDGQMMNIFKVEVSKTGVQPKMLKELLIKLTSNSS